MGKFKIVARGSGKECLTWADDSNLDIVKAHLEREGYTDVQVTLEKPKPFHPDHLKRMGVTMVEGDGV